ncbi:hypothetical protein TNCV_87091 [Trichonephila clavipes]|nr:hypothetical protein TNCV_87091 [Trichonephila clavipes]
MSGELAAIPFHYPVPSSRKFSTRQVVRRSISNDVEVCAPVNGDATIHQHSPTTKSDFFMHLRRIIPTATLLPDENTPIIRMKRKTRLIRKKEHCSIYFSSSSHALLSTPCGRDDALMLV